MPNQTPDSDSIVIVMMFCIAMFVFAIMLVAFALMLSEERKNRGLTWQEFAKLFAARLLRELPKKERAEPVSEPSSEPVPFESVPQEEPKLNFLQRELSELRTNRIQALNWLACLVVASYVSWWNYVQLDYGVDSTSLYPYFVLLAAVSPACFGVAWLRLTGEPWRRAFLFLILGTLASAAVIGLYLLIGIIRFFASGHCC